MIRFCHQKFYETVGNNASTPEHVEQMYESLPELNLTVDC